MNRKVLLLALVLADFLALTAWALYRYGYVGLFDQALANAATMQVFADLVIALSCAMLWMWRDARERAISPTPYLLLTMTLGSIGLLTYLIRRELAPLGRPVAAPAR